MFQGVTDATMTHGEGWHFMELGRYLERATATAALLEVQYRECEWAADQAAGVSEYVEWVGLLKSCCAFEAYCRHYTADVRPKRIAEFLVLNTDFPRSVHFAARGIHSSLHALGTLTHRENGRADRLSGRLVASLDYGQMDEIIAELPAYLQGIVRQAGQINACRAPAVCGLSYRDGPDLIRPCMSAHYAIRHTTSFAYESPVSETVMELRMRPATGGPQRCLQFEVEVQPRARIFAYRDFLGNWVHHFDIPRRHPQLLIVARAQVQLDLPALLPEALPGDAWLTWTSGPRAATNGTSGSRATSPPGRRRCWISPRRSAFRAGRTPTRSPRCAPPCPPFTAASSTSPTRRVWTRQSTMRSSRGRGCARTSLT